jgi:hypothetical protein
VVVILSGAGATVMLNDWVAIWAGVAMLSAFTVKLDVPAAAGVPEMTPALNDIPAGRLPEIMVQLQGHVTALAVKVWL